MLLLLTSGCSRLIMFNTVVPRDEGVVRVVHDAAYAPGRRGMIDVYAPRGASGGPARPIIVFLYGGSWRSGTKDGYGFVGRAFAARGFVVAIPDYRLVPEVRYPAFVEDGAAAVRWVRAHAGEWGGDPSRIVLVGHSAGAYNAAMLAYDPRWLGPDRSAIRGFAGLAGPYDFDPFDGPIAAAAFQGAAEARDTQPVTHVAPGAPPALLATGDKDTTVRPANSESLAARLTQVGTPASLRRYPRVGHVGILTAIAKPWRDRAPVVDDVAAFAASVTAPR
ncbi:alpha/beta hydrolase [Novosphingobium flavum]|uniref:Alpha/beta hydrolase n=2 Tax=Novosphingobium aerophilum TaxID=2839843 RepID=A0A7X1KBZ8_9SPHN|nr:alpha/beta hydrolase [Novosphingobium aerophilum]